MTLLLVLNQLNSLIEILRMDQILYLPRIRHKLRLAISLCSRKKTCNSIWSNSVLDFE